MEVAGKLTCSCGRWTLQHVRFKLYKYTQSNTFSVHRFNILIHSLVQSLVYYRGVAVRQPDLRTAVQVRPMDYIVGTSGCYHV